MIARFLDSEVVSFFTAESHKGIHKEMNFPLRVFAKCFAILCGEKYLRHFLLKNADKPQIRTRMDFFKIANAINRKV